MELKAYSSQERLGILRKVLAAVHNAGRDGITPQVLRVSPKSIIYNLLDWLCAFQTVAQIQKIDLISVIEELARTTVPWVYWTGYASLVLVSAPFIKYWSVKLSENPLRQIFPRRWLDTDGCKIREFWQAALKAVLGLVIFRPGISHVRVYLRASFPRLTIL
jgi:transcription factor C subunit 3